MEIDYEKLEEQANPGAFNQYDMAAIVPILQKLEDGSVYVEVGVDKGRSLSVAKMVTKPTVMLFGVDVNYQEEANRLVDERTQYIWADSVFLAKVWPSYFGTRIDVLFIDGEHSYAGCQRDIAAWYPLMRSRGVMLFHDYDSSSPGVIQAVDEFAKKLGVEVLAFDRGKTSIAKIQL